MFSPGAFCLLFRVSPIRLSSELLACCVLRVTYPLSLHREGRTLTPWWAPLRRLQEDKCFEEEQGKRFRRVVEKFGLYKDGGAIIKRGKERNLWIKEPDTH